MSEEIRETTPEIARDPRQPADFDPLALGRMLLRAVRTGALGTLDPQSGAPFVSLTAVATDLDGSPVILISRLSQHTQNLLNDRRASLMLAQGGKGDPLAHPRLTLQGEVEPVSAHDLPRVRTRYLARQPKAKLYADFPDFGFFRLHPRSMHLNGGFARAFDGEARLILTPPADAEAFHRLEAAALDHMNDEHAEALALYATKLCGAAPGPWRATGLDPDGLDLLAGDQVARLTFDARITHEADLRDLLKTLARRARES